MALTTTPGAALADSYATVAEADAYLPSVGVAWGGTTAAKEAALRAGTRWVEGRHRSRWPGVRLYGRAQSRDWPRAQAYDAEGWAIDAETIPIEVVQATCHAAAREQAAPGSLSPDGGATPQMTSVKAGSVAVTYAEAKPGEVLRPVLTVVDDILAPLLGRKQSSSWLVRA